MVNISNVKEHERVHFVDNLISNTEEILTDKAVERRLAKETCARFLTHINHLLIPNIRDNKIVLPGEYENEHDFIPLIAFNPEHDTKLHINHENLVNQTNQQFDKTKEYLAGFMELHNEPESVVDMLNAINDEIYNNALNKNFSSSDISVRGATIHSRFKTEIFSEKTNKRRSRYFEGKPSVAMPTNVKSDYIPISFIHELAHCDEVIQNPYGKPPGKKAKVDKYNLNHELIAHHVESTVKDALYNESNNSKFRENEVYGPNQADAIEELRIEHNDKKDPFEPKASLARDLRDKANLDFFF